LTNAATLGGAYDRSGGSPVGLRGRVFAAVGVYAAAAAAA